MLGAELAAADDTAADAELPAAPVSAAVLGAELAAADDTGADAGAELAADDTAADVDAEVAAADDTAADVDAELAAPVSEAVVDGLFEADAAAPMTTSAPSAISPVSTL